MRVGEGRVQRIRDRIGLLPNDAVYEAIPEALQRETQAEDDMVRARHPQGTVGLQDTSGFPKPSNVPFVILLESHRANRVTTSY